jgi:hypothetical protein
MKGDVSGPGPDGGERLERLYEQALALPAGERDAFLDAACGDDAALRAELTSLLAEGGGAETFMEDVGRLVDSPVEGAPSELVQALAHRYAIAGAAGEGGMATVYRARDLRHDRLVALKVLKPELAAIVGAHRFLAEIKTTAKLQHASILPLFDSGEAGGHLFYVMPFVEGESLRERLAREHQLPVDEAVAIAVSVAQALDYAHRQGVIHRDVKPANVLLRDGAPVISDFGIALAVSTGGGGRLTETGLSLGTPHYMSPEQATGDRNVGPATDIYSLGCVLYEMLVGEPPFTGSTPQAVLGRIITGEVEPVSGVRKSIPPNVDAAVRTALEKVPADRFRSGAAFADALRTPSFGETGVWNGRAGATPRWKTPAQLASAAAIGAILTWWIAGVGGSPNRAPMRLSTVLPPGQELVGPQQLRLSSDGSMLVYTGPAEGEGQWQLWAHRWSSPDGTGRPVPNTRGVVDFDPSPENDEVVLVSEGALRVQSLESSAVRTMVSNDVRCCVTWSDDGGWIFFTNAEGGVSRVPARGGEPQALTAAATTFSDRWAAPISGTDLVVFERGQPYRIGSQIWLLDVRSGDTRVLVEGSSPVPFGDLILFSTEGSGPELRYVNAFAEEAVVTTLASNIGGTVAGRPTFDASATGHLVYSEFSRSTLSSMGVPVWVDRDGRETPVDPALTMPLGRVRLSPDDSHLLLSALLGGGRSAIHVKELPNGPLVLVRPSDELNMRPFWAADGSVIYSTAAVSRDSVTLIEVRRLQPDGTGEPESVGLLWPEAMVTPEGEWWIYRTPNYPDDPDLMAVPTRGDSEPLPLAATDASESQPTVSRDSRWLAYTSDASGVPQVYVQAFPEAGSRTQVTTNGGEAPAFSPGTDELFVVEDGWMVAYAYQTVPAFRVTGREPLFDASSYSVEPGGQAHNYDVTRDGGRFVMVRPLDPGGVASPEIVLLLDYLTTLEAEARR